MSDSRPEQRRKLIQIKGSDGTTVKQEALQNAAVLVTYEDEKGDLYCLVGKGHDPKNGNLSLFFSSPAGELIKRTQKKWLHAQAKGHQKKRISVTWTSAIPRKRRIKDQGLPLIKREVQEN